MTVTFQVPDNMFERITKETGYNLGATPSSVVENLPSEFNGHWLADDWEVIEFESEKDRDWFVLRWS